jgi:hypothetical protein
LSAPPCWSFRFARQERISIDLKSTSVLFAARPLKGVDRRSNPDVNKTDVFQHFLPGCTRQTTGNSSCPKVDVMNGRLGHRLSVGDVRKLKVSAWT